MPIPEQQPHTFDHLLELMQQIVGAWSHLTEEQQTAIALIFWLRVNTNRLRDQMQRTKETLLPERNATLHLFPGVSLDDLRKIGFTDAELARFDTPALETIAHTLQAHYLETQYWDDLLVVAEQLFVERDIPNTTTPARSPEG